MRGPQLFLPAMIALFTSLRLGEVLALRQSDVDLVRKTLSVRWAIEQRVAHGIRLKAPKGKAGRPRHQPA